MFVCEEIAHLLGMSLIGLKVDERLSDKKNEILKRVRLLMDEQPDVEINKQYIEGIKSCITEDTYDLNFFMMRDQIRDWYRSS